MEELVLHVPKVIKQVNKNVMLAITAYIIVKPVKMLPHVRHATQVNIGTCLITCASVRTNIMMMGQINSARAAFTTVKLVLKTQVAILVIMQKNGQWLIPDYVFVWTAIMTIQTKFVYHVI